MRRSTIAPLHEAAGLLYDGPWVAERYAVECAARRDAGGDASTVRGIIAAARTDARPTPFEACTQLEGAARARAPHLWRAIDVLLVPTAPTHLHDAADAGRSGGGSTRNLGVYTNFVNLLDCCALAVPACVHERPPFGMTFSRPRATTRRSLARPRFPRPPACRSARPAGRSPRSRRSRAAAPSGETGIAVVGAHLSGMPLNGQLKSFGARFLERTTTTADYRLFLLPGTTPAKPGLLRVGADAGVAVDVEIWTMPAEQFGRFVASIPAVDSAR